jgi:hypothetical protein
VLRGNEKFAGANLLKPELLKKKSAVGLPQANRQVSAGER